MHAQTGYARLVCGASKLQQSTVCEVVGLLLPCSKASLHIGPTMAQLAYLVRWARELPAHQRTVLENDEAAGRVLVGEVLNGRHGVQRDFGILAAILQQLHQHGDAAGVQHLKGAHAKHMPTCAHARRWR
eukprot:6184769-Pleurochrysis_carterae.AAC.3